MACKLRSVMFQSIGFSEDIDKGIMKENMKWIIVFYLNSLIVLVI